MMIYLTERKEMCKPVDQLFLADEPDPHVHVLESGAPPPPHPPASVE